MKAFHHSIHIRFPTQKTSPTLLKTALVKIATVVKTQYLYIPPLKHVLPTNVTDTNIYQFAGHMVLYVHVMLLTALLSLDLAVIMTSVSQGILKTFLVSCMCFITMTPEEMDCHISSDRCLTNNPPYFMETPDNTNIETSYSAG